MTSDDENESKHKAEASDQRVSLLIPVKSPDGRSMQNEIDEKQDGNESDAAEIEKDLEAEMALTTATISDKGRKVREETEPFSPDYQQLRECQNYKGSLVDERENEVKDSSRHERSVSSERLPKVKHKRGFDVKNIDEKSGRTKRLKAEKLAQAPCSPGVDVQMFESSVGFTKDTWKGPTIQVANRDDRQGNPNVGLDKGFNRAFPGKSTSVLLQTGQRYFDHTLLGNPFDPLEKSDKLGEKLGHSRKHSRKDFHVGEGSCMQKDKSHRNAQNEYMHVTKKKVPRNSRDGSNGSKQSLSMDSNYQKQGEMFGNLKQGQQGTHSRVGTSAKDNNRIGLDKSPVINRRGITHQRVF